MPKEKEKIEKKVLSLEEAMKLAEEIEEETNRNKPSVLILQYMPVIEKLRNAGKSWEEITVVFNEQIGIEIKAYSMKEAYFKAHPEEKITRSKKEEEVEKKQYNLPETSKESD